MKIVTSHGGGGSKIGQKSVIYYLNGPLPYPVGEKGDAPENPIGCAPNGDDPAGRKN